MKILFSILIAYVTVAVYFIFINFSSIPWFPFVLAVFLIGFFYADKKMSTHLAVAMGIFMDLHFMYLGPYTAIFLCIRLTLNKVKKAIAPQNNIVSVSIMTIIASIEYAVLIALFSLFANGITSLTSKSMLLGFPLRAVTITLYVVLVQLIVYAIKAAVHGRGK